jgi:predicted acetyltransferase
MVKTQNGLRLIRPTQGRRDHYVEALREFMCTSHNACAIQDEIDTVDDYIERQRRGDLAHIDYWLVDDYRCYGSFQLRPSDATGSQAYYDIRPKYQNQGFGRQILALGLLQAREAGMTRLDIAAESDNISSRRIIQANGGRLLNERQVGDRQLTYYQIDLT